MSSVMDNLRNGVMQEDDSFVVVYSDRMSEEEEGSPCPSVRSLSNNRGECLQNSAETVVGDSAGSNSETRVEDGRNLAAGDAPEAPSVAKDEPEAPVVGAQQSLMTNSEQDFLSITSYSGSSAGSNEYETVLEETRVKMSEIIQQNQTLKKSLDNANNELLEHVSKTQEMKRNSLVEAQKFAEMNEKSRHEIEKLREEKKQLADSLAECEEMLNRALEENLIQKATDSANTAKPEDLESLEMELKRTNSQLAHKETLIRGLQDTIGSEMEQNKALKELIRRNEEYVKRNNEVLSRSDEAVAKSLSEREDLQSKISQLQNQVDKLKDDKSTLESTVSEFHLRSDTAKKAFEVAKTNYDKIIAANEALRGDKEKLANEIQDQTVMVAAMRAEHDQQLDQFRMNFSEKDAEIKRLTVEKRSVEEELSRIMAVLQQKTDELNDLRRYNNRTEETSVQTDRPHRSVFRVVHPDVDIREGPVAGSFEFVEAGQHTPIGTPGSVPVPDPSTFGPCPLCNKNFPTQKKLTIHAATCGEDFIEEQGRRSDPFVFP